MKSCHICEMVQLALNSVDYQNNNPSSRLKSTINACVTAYNLFSKLDKGGEIRVKIKQKIKIDN